MSDEWIIPNSTRGYPDHRVSFTAERELPVRVSIDGHPAHSLAPAEARAIATALTTAASLAEGKH